MIRCNTMLCGTVPEIQRVSVAQVVLQLKVLGVKSPMDFPYISPPSIAALKKALEMLYLLGALNPVFFLLSFSFLFLFLFILFHQFFLYDLFLIPFHFCLILLF